MSTVKATEGVAEAKRQHGDCKGPPLVVPFARKYPSVLKMVFIPPVFHTKIHVTSDVACRLLRKLRKLGTPGFKKLFKAMKRQQDSLSNGTIGTNATGLFRLAVRCENFW